MSQRFKWRSGVCQRNSKADDSLRGHENESFFPEQKKILSKNSSATESDAKEYVCAHKYEPEKHANQETGQSTTSSLNEQPFRLGNYGTYRILFIILSKSESLQTVKPLQRLTLDCSYIIAGMARLKLYILYSINTYTVYQKFLLSSI